MHFLKENTFMAIYCQTIIMCQDYCLIKYFASNILVWFQIFWYTENTGSFTGLTVGYHHKTASVFKVGCPKAIIKWLWHNFYKPIGFKY